VTKSPSGAGRSSRIGRWLRGLRRPQLALIALVLAAGIGYGVDALHSSTGAGHPAQPSSTSATSVAPASAVALSSLPPQVAQTVHLIEAGGPFPYSQDGVVFDNNEHLLPAQPHGYYHEYTVVTPGANDRATRRIVTGRSGEYFYTADHYESFRRVDIAR
jgi:ribonuclease T1